MAPSPPLRPWKPPTTANYVENDWRQFLEGISSPPTPKLDTRVPRYPPPPLLDITPADDEFNLQDAFEKRLEQDGLALIQQRRLNTPREADLEVHADAEDSAARKRRHRRSNGSWISIPKEGRPRSAAGESVKSVKRKSNSKAEEESRQTAKKGHEKSASSSSKPKGFRETFHGIFH